MDAGVGPELLAPQPDRAEQQDHRVERVPALPRVGRRVGLEAVEDDVDVLGRERLRLDVVPVAGMEQQRGVDARRTGRPRSSICLPLPRSSAGVPRNTISPGSSSRDRGERDRGADPGRGHRVVAAAVAETGQRVVLGEDPDPRPAPAPAAAPGRPDRGREPAGRMLHLEAVAREGLRDPGRRLALLEGRLRDWRGSGGTAR